MDDAFLLVNRKCRKRPNDTGREGKKEIIAIPGECYLARAHKLWKLCSGVFIVFGAQNGSIKDTRLDAVMQVNGKIIAK